MFSQISASKSVLVGKIAPIAAMGKMYASCKKSGNTYKFTYLDVAGADLKDKDHYQSFSFKDVDNAFDNLYNIIMEGLKNAPKDNIVIKTPSGDVALHFFHVLGAVNFRFEQNTSVKHHSMWLTKRKVKKLFGRKR